MDELLSQLQIDLDDADASLMEAIHGITDTEGARNVVPGTWSIADCIVHLYQIEMSVLAIIRKQADDATALHHEFTKLGRTFLREKLLNRSQKVKLPEAIAGRMETMPITQALKKLTTVRRMLKEIVNSGKIANPQMIFPHPVFGEMTKIDWLFSVPFHSLRHTEQIKEIRSKLQ